MVEAIASGILFPLNSGIHGRDVGMAASWMGAQKILLNETRMASDDFTADCEVRGNAPPHCETSTEVRKIIYPLLRM